MEIARPDFAPSTTRLPALFAPDALTARRVIEFFTANINNPNTRKAYARAAAEFADWCGRNGIGHLRDVQPIHVAAHIQELQRRIAIPSVKVRLAGIRMLFDWLVLGQVMPTNPASVVRGPKHQVRKGTTPVLTADETRDLLDAIDTGSPIGLRDRALIALMTYTFARVGAAAGKMRVEDVYVQGRRTWVRLHEKGGKRHEMPCHHKLEAYLQDYIEARRTPREGAAAFTAKAWLFPSVRRRTGHFTERPMSQADVYRMVRRRAAAAGIKTQIGCHTFRATGITEYLRNGGKLEIAQQMANHESARTTGLYDRRNDRV
ncbi:MAG: tyrosine-type recombinase/integrase, partial [Candidatus Solibacter sp.]